MTLLLHQFDVVQTEIGGIKVLQRINALRSKRQFVDTAQRGEIHLDPTGFNRAVLHQRHIHRAGQGIVQRAGDPIAERTILDRRGIVLLYYPFIFR